MWVSCFLTGTQEPVEFGGDVERVYLFEGAESDGGSGKGPIGAREMPGSDALAGYASCHELLQFQRRLPVAAEYLQRRYQIGGFGGSTTSSTKLFSFRYNPKPMLLVPSDVHTLKIF